MNDKKIKILKQWISLGALTIALVHLLFPKIAIDGVTLGLIVLAILPWLSPIIKSFEFPGGLKIELQELQETSDRASSIGLLSELPTTQYTFQSIADSDSNLALAGLRIEIEKRLNRLAEIIGVDERRKGIGILLGNLTKNKILNSEEEMVIGDMIKLLNLAVHGAEVDSKAADWAINIGPRLLKSLDIRISKNEKEYVTDA